MKDYKGKVLLFQESNYNSTVRSFEPVLNAVNAVSKAYEDLDTSFKFTQEVFEDIIINDTKKISEQYAARIEDQIQSSKFTSKAIINSMRENVSAELVEVSAKIKAMHAAQQTATSLQSAYPVELEFIKIEDGKAVLNNESKEAIREFFTRKIQTYEQNKLYNLMLGIKDKYDEITSYLKQSGIDLNAFGEIISDKGNGLCYEDNGQFIIDPHFLTIKLKPHVSTIE